ncbi:MAG: lysostaphin resistance A-like protein [Paracoccaceae bacterium]
MSYAAFSSMIESAAVRPAFWRVVAGLITVILLCTVWILVVLAVVNAATGWQGLAAPGAGAEGPAATIMFLFLIVGLGLGSWGAARLWHRRSLGSLIGRGARTLRDFVIAALLTWGLAAILMLIALPFSDPLVPNMPFAEWLTWLPLALLAILLQTGSEEVLFRGYLQSQLAARFQATWVWLFVPSLMFGALHYLPGETVGPGLVYVASTTLFGVIAADLTARTGSLGAAWGLHFANNCIAVLVVVYLGAASGLGLYSAGTIEEALMLSPLLVVDIALLVVLWLVIRRAVAG